VPLSALDHFQSPAQALDTCDYVMIVHRDCTKVACSVRLLDLALAIVS
jgi:hypothetical protein